MIELTEGLRPEDLQGLVNPKFEIDSYRSKMGEDTDVVVVSFNVKDRMPATDLMEFLEKGYAFILDADVSSGENSLGEYHVFVELRRSPSISRQIKEMMYGIERLTGINDWKFKYHKDNTEYDLSEDNISKIVPLTPSLYERKMNSVKVEEYKKFFNKTLMDDLALENDIITIFKPYGQKIKLQIIKNDLKENMLEGLNDSLSIDNVSMGEIFWLTKVLGDYKIEKVGENFFFENGDRAILLKRID